MDLSATPLASPTLSEPLTQVSSSLSVLHALSALIMALGAVILSALSVTASLIPGAVVGALIALVVLVRNGTVRVPPFATSVPNAWRRVASFCCGPRGAPTRMARPLFSPARLTPPRPLPARRRRGVDWVFARARTRPCVSRPPAPIRRQNPTATVLGLVCLRTSWTTRTLVCRLLAAVVVGSVRSTPLQASASAAAAPPIVPAAASVVVVAPAAAAPVVAVAAAPVAAALPAPSLRGVGAGVPASVVASPAVASRTRLGRRAVIDAPAMRQ